MMTTPDQGGHWGILGGTFDPVHHGHLNLALQVATSSNLDGVLLVPSLRHPFKDVCRASFGHRMEMLMCATSGEDRFVVSGIEMDEDLPGYTIDSIRAIRERYPYAIWSFIIGEDNLEELERWRDPEAIFAEVRVLVGQRPPHQWSDHISRFSADRIEMVAIDMLDVSSTEIRRLLNEGGPEEELAEMMPRSVVQYIKKHGLYR
jgi:nicotinate-nucleotide adenylyltransferase